MVSDIFAALDIISSKSTSYIETWGNITIDIDYYDGVINDLEYLSTSISSLNKLLSPRIVVEHTDVEINEIEDYENTSIQVIINKNVLTICDGYNLQFFHQLDCFEQWITNLNPFIPTEFEKIKVVVNGLKFVCGGSNFLISGDSNDAFDDFAHGVPNDKIILNHVTIPNGRNITFNASKYLITFVLLKATDILKDHIQKRCYENCLKNSAATLCSTFASELDNNSIILQGVRRVKLQLYNNTTKVDLNLVLLLKDIVNWIYQDYESTKIKIRIKLLLDRITLDINCEYPLLNGISGIINDSYEQAKERYHFVMLERRDAYANELRNLLKDIKSQSDLYTAKIRMLLNNLMRDVLAGLLFVGFSLFTKFAEIQKLLEHEKLITLLFRSLAIYFIISAFMQIITDITDLYMSKKELKYWCKTTSELLPKKELEEHIKHTLRGRNTSAIIFYVVIILLYGLIVYLSWNFPCLWKTYLK